MTCAGFTAAAVGLVVCAVAHGEAPAYTNPLDVRMGDPFVLRHGGTYYLFGTTSSNEGFQYYTSMDLVRWTPGGWAWRKAEDSWAEAAFWAPEVKRYRGKFYMTYSGRLRGVKPARLLTALAVSDRPEGPYQDLHAPWFDDGHSAIDAHLFVDSGDTPYLFYSRNGQRDGYSYGVIYGAALAADLSKPLGESVKLLEADQPWERINWSWNRCNEGPFVLKRHGKYYMTYSANNTGAPGYAVGYAVAERPLGPWSKNPDNPLLASNLEIGVSSPGHSSITTSPDGSEMFIVYHSHADPDQPKGPRVVNIDRLFFDPDGALRVRGPTRSPQPMPSGAANERVAIPQIDGEWWQVAGNPDLGGLTTPRQQPVDFAVWQAADGTWQLWSCIRNTGAPGRTRLLYRWQGAKLTDSNWEPMGIAMQADPSFGETPGGLQAPHVVRIGREFVMHYGDWEHICRARSEDGKTFARQLTLDNQSGVFSEGPGTNTRDVMLLEVGRRWHAYYTAYPEKKGAVYVRTSNDLRRWSASKVVAFGGSAGEGPFSAECPFVYYHKESGHYYLFRTQAYGRNAKTSVYRSKDPTDFGIRDDRFLVTTLPIAAPEIVEHEGRLYIAALLPELNGIRIARLKLKP